MPEVWQSTRSPRPQPRLRTPRTRRKANQDNQDPLKRQLSDKERFKQQKELKQEIGTAYKKWLDEDVRWIITDQEKKAFMSLSNDEERDAFIEQFWRRQESESGFAGK